MALSIREYLFNVLTGLNDTKHSKGNKRAKGLAEFLLSVFVATWFHNCSDTRSFRYIHKTYTNTYTNTHIANIWREITGFHFFLSNGLH